MGQRSLHFYRASACNERDIVMANPSVRRSVRLAVRLSGHAGAVSKAVATTKIKLK